MLIMAPESGRPPPVPPDVAAAAAALKPPQVNYWIVFYVMMFHLLVFSTRPRLLFPQVQKLRQVGDG